LGSAANIRIAPMDDGAEVALPPPSPAGPTPPKYTMPAEHPAWAADCLTFTVLDGIKQMAADAVFICPWQSDHIRRNRLPRFQRIFCAGCPTACPVSRIVIEEQPASSAEPPAAALPDYEPADGQEPLPAAGADPVLCPRAKGSIRVSRLPFAICGKCHENCVGARMAAEKAARRANDRPARLRQYAAHE
jgi:hypothetical protein